jgi:hypothetical protein
MAPETTAYVVDVPVRDGEGMQVGDTFRNARHLEMGPVLVRRLRSDYRQDTRTRRYVDRTAS